MAAKLHIFIAMTYIVLHFIFSLIFGLFPAAILRAIGATDLSRRWIRFHSIALSRGILASLGGRVTVQGLEHLPEHEKRLCIIANHQSVVDIPLIVGFLPVLTGFIAKQELTKNPIIILWREALNCGYIDRKNPRSQVRAIIDGAKRIQEGHPLLIFPEGTRSRSERFGEFKPGSVKLATRAKAVIIPVTIQNTFRLFERKSGLRRVPVGLVVHAPITTADLDEQELKSLPSRVRDILMEECGHADTITSEVRSAGSGGR